MPPKKEEEKCDLGTIDHKGKCWTKKNLTRKLIEDAEFDLTPPARAYLNNLDKSEMEFGTEGVDIQIAYIQANLITDTKAQELVLQQLDDILKGRPLSTSLKEKDVNTISEVELERIMMGFERFTEGKVSELHQLRDKIEYGEIEETPELRSQMEKMKLTIKDYIAYSKTRDIPVDKVLVASDWVEEVLADEVINAKKEASKRITIEWQ